MIEEEQIRQFKQIQEELSKDWVKSDPYFVHQCEKQIEQIILNWEFGNWNQNKDILKYLWIEIFEHYSEILD